MESFLVDALTELSAHFGPALLAVGALVAFAEAALGLGFVFPGEWAVLALGAGTTTGSEVVLAMGVVALGASAGDHVGYLVGRRVGPALGRSRLIRRIGTHHWDRGTALVQRHGSVAVLISRLLPAVRTIVPAAAGAGGLTYLRFVVGSALGAMVWAAMWVGGGALARTALPEVAATLGAASWYLFGAVVLVAATVWVARRRRARTRMVTTSSADRRDRAAAAPLAECPR
ncbi:DedA family protein [Georgenia deserti]|uniref:DedA family protein n=1 Tax=Georgenia deserti TaxID=2093781 RepID=A0ABW4L4J7_9MICO